jgi:hypothetical protein
MVSTTFAKKVQKRKHKTQKTNKNTKSNQTIALFCLQKYRASLPTLKQLCRAFAKKQCHALLRPQLIQQY